MGERELREKYGGKLAKAINRAIRAEIPGGNEALDKLTQLAGPAWRSGWAEKNGKPTEPAVVYQKHKRDVVDKMEAQIRRQYGIPPAEPEEPNRGRGSSKSSGRKKSRRPKPSQGRKRMRNTNRHK
jgi:hypothetical protein